MKNTKKKGEAQKAENIARARERYDRRAENRPRQTWVQDTETTGHWEKVK